MASNNNRPGGKRPNSPRYSDRYGPGHVNPYMGAQPGQSAFIRDMEERQEAARRQSEEAARRQREQEAENRRREQEAARRAQAARAEDEQQQQTAAAGQERIREREDSSQPRAMRDPKTKERLRQIQERAVREAKSFARGDEADFGDIDFIQQPPDVRLKLSEDGQPLIALESEDGNGGKSVRWVPVVLSEKEMESFFPAFGSAQESKGIEVQEEIKTPAENTKDEPRPAEPEMDELVLIPMDADNAESEAQPVSPAAGAAVELLNTEPDEPEQPAEPEAEPEIPRGAGLAAMLSALPSIEIEAEPVEEQSAGGGAAMLAGAAILAAAANDAEQDDPAAQDGEPDSEPETEPEPEPEAEPAVPASPSVEYDIPDGDDEDEQPEDSAEPEETSDSDEDQPDDGEDTPEETPADDTSDDTPEGAGEDAEADVEPEPDTEPEPEDDTDHAGDENTGEAEDTASEEAGEPEADAASEPEDSSEEDAGEQPSQETHEDDAPAVTAEEPQEEQSGEPEAAPEPPPQPRRKRRRSRPTDVQIPDELAAAAAAREEQEAEPQTEPEDTAPRRTAVAVAGYDSVDEDDSGQDDRMFRRTRQAVKPVFTMHEGANIPKYIDDDDFVERWLGDDEEDEDLASQKKNKRRRMSAFIGAATMILALIGFIAVAKWGIGLLGNLGGSESQKDIYGEFVSPVVMSEVPVFETWDAIPQEKLLQSAVFTVLMDNDVTYERDDTGKFIVPSTDIVNAVKEMYGAASTDAAQDEEINTQIRNALYGSAGEDVTNEDAYYVDMEDSFHVADNLSGPAPNVTDISKRDNTVTLRVEYMEDLETSTGGILYARQIILNLNEDGSYYVKAIREQQD